MKLKTFTLCLPTLLTEPFKRLPSPRCKFIRSLYLLSALATFASPAFSQSAGMPDPSWTLTTMDTPLNAIAIQPDGKVVATGGDGNRGFATVRFKKDGSLDSSFGTGGTVNTVI